MQTILDARERRGRLLMSHGGTVVVLKANTPGLDKNTVAANRLLGIFKEELAGSTLFVEYSHYSSEDGDFYLFQSNQPSKRIKKEMVAVEQKHFLGRLVDLDVYEEGMLVSRNDLNLAPRRCFLCDEKAHVCVRNKTHSIVDLNAFIEKKLSHFEAVEHLVDLIYQSLVKEANAYPKFGLVSRMDSGIHTDMTIDSFLESAELLIPFFKEMGYATYEPDGLIQRLEEIGLRAERKMLLEIGANTHKGAIFIFGLLIGAYFTRGEKTLQNRLKELASYKLKDFDESSENTTGLKVFKTHRIHGIRGEMANGMPSVFDHSLPFYMNAKQLSEDELLNATLIKLMSVVDDTVQIGKTSLDHWRDIQKECARILDFSHHRSKEGKERIEDLQKRSIVERLSPGGCADLLSATLFLAALKKER